MKKHALYSFLLLGVALCSGPVLARSSVDSLVVDPQTVGRAAAPKPLVSISFEKAGKLEISGFIQFQWQLAQQKGAPAFADAGDFALQSDNRFMVRRGRIKFEYTQGIMQLVLLPDFTEKGAKTIEAYLNLTAPSGVIAGRVGLYENPFGYENNYSSAKRESPERTRLYTSLFPSERDLGASLTLRGPRGTAWNNLSLEAGFFNGNGLGAETDSHKDFSGRLVYYRTFAGGAIGAALSYYGGGVLNPVNTQYTFDPSQGFVANTGVQGSYSPRHYLGVAARYAITWAAGTTSLRGEYLWGQQPGTVTANADPGGSSFGAGTLPLYLRDFRGGYLYLIQDIDASRHAVVFKYDRYDPNSRVSGSQIGTLAGTGVADIAYDTYGIGYLFRWNSHLQLMAYYDMVANERCPALGSTNPLIDYARNVKDNVLTLRVQARF